MVRDADEKNFAKDVADFSDARTMGPAGVHIFNSINFSIAPGVHVTSSGGEICVICTATHRGNWPRPDVFVVLRI